MLKGDTMSVRRFYRRIERGEAIQQIFFILNLTLVEDECLICYEKIEEHEETIQDNVICHECNKAMHLTCIERWFNENNFRKCPHCRTNWKFEIDITEKPKPIRIQLDDYSVLPRYRNQDRDNEQEQEAEELHTIFNNRRQRLTVMGSIAGPIHNERFNDYETITNITGAGTITINNNTLNNNILITPQRDIIRNQIDNARANGGQILAYRMYQQAVNGLEYEN
jgi:hypothetical protein